MAGPWDDMTPGAARSTPRHAHYDDSSANRPILGAVQRIAEERDVPTEHVALAWVLRNPAADASAALEEHYTPRLPAVTTDSFAPGLTAGTSRWRGPGLW